MMTDVDLDDVLPEAEKVKVGRGSLDINGLDITQISKLLMLYQDGMLTFFSMLEPNKEVDFSGLILSAPEMVLDIIAAGAGVEDQREKLRKMPVQYQLDCLRAVFRLSVPDLGKFIESLVGLLATLRSARRQSFPSVTSDPSIDSSEDSSPTSLTPSSGRVTASVK